MPNSPRIKWTESEDQKLTELISKHGKRAWTSISKELVTEGFQLKSGKQCRERWFNQLDPDLKIDEWTIKEAKILFDYIKQNGKKWSKISEVLPGRSENSAKNYFYSTVRKNIRYVNKKLVLKNRLEGTIDELLLDPIASKLVFCSSRKCRRLIEELSSTIKKKEEEFNEEKYDEGLQDSTFMSLPNNYFPEFDQKLFTDQMNLFYNNFMQP